MVKTGLPYKLPNNQLGFMLVRNILTIFYDNGSFWKLCDDMTCYLQVNIYNLQS